MKKRKSETIKLVGDGKLQGWGREREFYLMLMGSEDGNEVGGIVKGFYQFYRS